MTTTEDPYVPVAREDLKVGMRFDFRTAGETHDGHTRTLVSLDPIAYDNYALGRITLTPTDTEGATFYVHRDDITLMPTLVPVEEARVGEVITLDLPESAEATASRLARGTRAFVGVIDGGRIEFRENDRTASTVSKYTHVWVLRPERDAVAETEPNEGDTADEATAGTPESPRERAAWEAGVIAGRDEGVREGYLKAHQEYASTTMEKSDNVEATRPRFDRESAVVLAIQALGGTAEASHALIPLAEQIEQYVNGQDEQQHETGKPSPALDAATLDALPIDAVVVDKEGDHWKKRPTIRDGRCWAMAIDRAASGYNPTPGRSSSWLVAAYGPIRIVAGA